MLQAPIFDIIGHHLARFREPQIARLVGRRDRRRPCRHGPLAPLRRVHRGRTLERLSVPCVIRPKFVLMRNPSVEPRLRGRHERHKTKAGRHKSRR